ncbi:MAG: hypothetical protein Q8Q73_00625 [Stagnimonas sp.]|nr:hypothetical protein [Stagnimonas sp.]
MNTRVLNILALSLPLGACTPVAPPARPEMPPPAAMTGADRDAHGCIGSAGYSWCERSQRCERPWELAAQQGFTLSPQAVDEFCRRPAAP